MLYKKRECTFSGGRIDIFYWDDCPDGQEEPDSYFYTGYVEVYVFGDGSIPLLGLNHWHIIYTWPKYEPLVFSQESDGNILIFLEDDCSFDDIHIGFAKLRHEEDAPRLPVAIADFNLHGGDIIKKIVALRSDGDAVEIPDETLH